LPIGFETKFDSADFRSISSKDTRAASTSCRTRSTERKELSIPELEKIEVKRISLGFRNSEIFIRIDDRTIILPPSAAKKLTFDLEEHIQSFEVENGKIKVFNPINKKSKSGQSLSKLLKSLYKSRKVTKRLVAVNTRRKK